MPRYAPVTPSAGATSTRPTDSRPERLEHAPTRRRAVGVHALQRAALDRQQQPQDAGRRGRRPAAQVSGTDDQVGDRLPQQQRHRGHGQRRDEPASSPAASVAASAPPSPSRPSAVSRAAATCSAEPGTARIRKVETSAASEP